MSPKYIILSLLLLSCMSGTLLRQDTVSTIPTNKIIHFSNLGNAITPYGLPSNSTSSDASWVSGCLTSAISIFAAEFGDKTFFVNCILAMTNNIVVVLLGAIVGILVMNICSCLLGLILPAFLSRKVTLIIAGCLFVIIGIVMIVKGCKGDDDEKEEAEEEIKKKRKHCSWLFAGTFLKTFALNFFAEWGDTSQITTILLAGNYPVMSVFVGSSIGNILCSLLAILAGKLLMGCIKITVITIIGGIVFLVFAAHTFFVELPGEL